MSKTKVHATIKSRRAFLDQLSANSRLWVQQPETVMMEELKKRYPNVSECTPLEALRILILDEAEKLVGGY